MRTSQEFDLLREQAVMLRRQGKSRPGASPRKPTALLLARQQLPGSVP